MEQCIECGKSGDPQTVRQCAACKTVRYCSRECQKKHWKVHKAHCKKDKTEEPPEQKTKAADRPPVSSSSAASVKREATSKVPKKGTSMDSGPLESCLKCERKSKEMKKCARCMEATYCSLDCQRSHWREHKAACQEIDVVTTEGFRRTEEREQAEQRAKKEQAQASKRREQDFLSSLLNNEHMASRTLTFPEALSRAKRLYPGARIVDRFRDLQNDFIFSPNSQNMVAVMRIKGVYPHFFRQGRCLEDSEGMSSFVLFHVEGSPAPYFHYERLIDGNFLCYEHAHMHFFADGTVGFRIDEAKDVHIMEP